MCTWDFLSLAMHLSPNPRDPRCSRLLFVITLREENSEISETNVLNFLPNRSHQEGRLCVGDIVGMSHWISKN